MSENAGRWVIEDQKYWTGWVLDLLGSYPCELHEHINLYKTYRDGLTDKDTLLFVIENIEHEAIDLLVKSGYSGFLEVRSFMVASIVSDGENILQLHKITTFY